MVCLWDLGFLICRTMVGPSRNVVQVFPKTGAVARFEEDCLKRNVLGGPGNVWSWIVLRFRVVLVDFQRAGVADVVFVVGGLVFDVRSFFIEGKSVSWTCTWPWWARV